MCTCLTKIFQGPKTVLIYMWDLCPLLGTQQKHTGCFLSILPPCVCTLSILKIKITE